MDPKSLTKLYKKLKVGKKNIKQLMKFLILKFLQNMISLIWMGMISLDLLGIKEHVAPVIQ